MCVPHGLDSCVVCRTPCTSLLSSTFSCVAAVVLQDKRNGSGSSAGGSSGFLSSLGKAVMGDLRISPRSPGGMQQGSSGGAARVTHLHLLFYSAGFACVHVSRVCQARASSGGAARVQHLHLHHLALHACM
jgi:hypothetical protein